jgi:heat shock protein HslJ
MNGTRKAGVVAVIAVLALTGCTSGTDVSGKWGSTDPGQPNLIVNSDGKYTGSDGCNTLSGTGTITDGAIVFGPMASTRKSCPDVNTWMDQASTGKVDGDIMTVLNGSGKKIGTLDRND